MGCWSEPVGCGVDAGWVCAFSFCADVSFTLCLGLCSPLLAFVFFLFHSLFQLSLAFVWSFFSLLLNFVWPLCSLCVAFVVKYILAEDPSKTLSVMKTQA